MPAKSRHPVIALLGVTMMRRLLDHPHSRMMTYRDTEYHVRHRFDPQATGADPSGGLSLHRRLCAGEPHSVLAVDAAWLARHARDAVVRLFLPRSAAGDAGARRHRGGAGGRPRQPDRQCRAAAGARARRAAAAAHFDFHERVRLPRQPQPGRRPHRAHRLSRRQIPQRRSRQGERRQRAQCLRSSPPPTGRASP